MVRPKDAELWKHNSNPETLKYIAVDELHTFDGAQGTDLACLLRRLKSRLNILPGHLCCIGTSATMGAKESADSIRNYAEDVFGESFEDDSVVTEDRLSANEFFADSVVVDFKVPSKEEANNLLMLSSDEDEIQYLRDAAKSWFDESLIVSDIMSDESRVAIGKQLMQHNFTQNLIAEANGTYMQSDHVVDVLRRRYPELTEMGDQNASAVLDALYALISHARIYDAKGKVRPFLNVQVQVWMRELRRLVAKVAEKDIKFALATDLNENQAKHYLPVVNCRDCGETGWASILNEQGSVAKGIAGVEVAAYLGIGKNQISRIETGRANCTIPQLYVLAQLLDCSVEYILFGKKPSLPYTNEQDKCIKSLIASFSK